MTWLPTQKAIGASLALAMLAYERRQVRSDELSEMLELAGAARLWGLVEWEEADGVGLFLDHSIDPDDVSFLQKGVGELWQTPEQGELCVGEIREMAHHGRASWGVVAASARCKAMISLGFSEICKHGVLGG